MKRYIISMNNPFGVKNNMQPRMRTAVNAIVSACVIMTSIACGKADEEPFQVETTVVERRDIVVTAQATGTVEPIDTVAVKSQASGLIMAMPVGIGSQVKPGDLLAQIDTRNLKNDYDRAVAAEKAAAAALTVAKAGLDRANSLYEQKVITADEHESAIVAAANAESGLVSAQTTLRNAKQALDWATVRAEVGGTIISKGASVGMVAQSAVSSVSGGNTILTIANLQRVRMRAYVNETDIGNVHSGMPVNVTIDAFPNRRFRGVVEKVEPSAVVEQSVTMFPVLVSLENLDQALLPGMNGEVTITTQDRRGVVAVPNDAVRSMRDMATIAPVLGVDPSTLGDMRARRRPSAESAGSGASGRPRMNGTPQLVFVKTGTTWTPRAVWLGANDFDYSEVLSGLDEGDTVALLGAVVMQAARDRRTDRARRMTGSMLPGGGGSSSSSSNRSSSRTSRSTSTQSSQQDSQQNSQQKKTSGDSSSTNSSANSGTSTPPSSSGN